MGERIGVIGLCCDFIRCVVIDGIDSFFNRYYGIFKIYRNGWKVGIYYFCDGRDISGVFIKFYVRKFFKCFFGFKFNGEYCWIIFDVDFC